MTLRALGLAVLFSVPGTLLACGSTLDSLGSDVAVGGADGATLAPVYGPSSYPNAFRTLLGKSDAETSTKVEDAFAQLFHGDASTEAIYFTTDDDQGYVKDVLHDDIRSEGIGAGMLIAVELDRREEFDRLWAYARAELHIETGAARGYFTSFCDEATPCLDPYGMQLFCLSLIFAHGRWGSTPDTPYESGALALLDVLRNKERSNGGVVDGVTDVFDASTALVREEPTRRAAGYTRSALEMPAAYQIFAQASGAPFWNDARDAARAHLIAAANASTGLWPTRSFFDGTPVPASTEFNAQGYRTQLNLAFDALWNGANTSRSQLADRLLGFFSAQGIDSYGRAYELDGTLLDPSREQGLIAVNGALALAGTRSDRASFVNAVWEQAIPRGEIRYYDGMLYLLSVLALSGQLRVY